MKKVIAVFEALELSRMIALWVFMVLGFGIIYYALSLAVPTAPLSIQGQPLSADLMGFGNAIYFSIITATTVGYSNLAPQGFAKVLVVIEILASIALFGLIISKIVAKKQEHATQELSAGLATLNFEENANTAVAELYVFRSEIKELQEQLLSLKTKKGGSQITQLKQQVQNFNATLKHLSRIDMQSIDTEHRAMHLALLSNALTTSWSRLVELLETFNNKKLSWKNESITTTIVECKEITKRLYEQYKQTSSGNATATVGEKLEDLNTMSSTLEKLC